MKALIQITAFIAISGFIGLTAMGWNDNEKGSAIDIIKTRILSVHEGKR